MKRFYFVKPWENLQNSKYQCILNSALELSKKLNIELAVCVNSINRCDDFIEKCFSTKTDVKKILKRERVSVDGVPVILESEKTLKRQASYKPRVYLALFPSQNLISLIEGNDLKEAIIIFSDTTSSEHLVEWKKKHNPIYL